VTQPKTPNRDPLEAAPIDEASLSDEQRLELAETKKRGRFITTTALRARLAERPKPG
jgi:hypothetical protein